MERISKKTKKKEHRRKREKHNNNKGNRRKTSHLAEIVDPMTICRKFSDLQSKAL